MKDVHSQMKKDKKKNGNKPNYFKVNIDAARAFDSILRHKLIQLLHDLGFNTTLVNAIANTLQGTSMEVDGESFHTF